MSALAPKATLDAFFGRPGSTHQALSALYQPSRLSSSYSLGVGLSGGHLRSGAGTDCGDLRCVALSDDCFFGTAMAALDATTKAMAAAIMQIGFIICRRDVPTVIRTMKWRDGGATLRSSISCNRCTQMSACLRLNQLPQFRKATFASHSSRIWVAQIDEAAE